MSEQNNTNFLSGSRRVLTVIFLMTIMLSSAFAQEQMGVASVGAEATIFKDEAGENGGGYNTKICIGNLTGTSRTRRGYVRYDLPEIPADATITRVVIELRQPKVRHMGAGRKAATIQVHRVDEQWMEGTGGISPEACGGGTDVMGLNWNNAPDHKNSSSASQAMTADEGFLILLDTDIGNDDDGLIADVQGWVDGSAENYGWMFRVAEENDADNARLVRMVSMTIYWTGGSVNEGISVNAGLNDAWFNLATAGQGFFFTVFPDIELFFLSWFTYDSVRPDEEVEAIFGEPGHRWVTALGTWVGNTVTLDVELTFGGILDSGDPPVSQEAGYGTIVVVFHTCNSATLTYNFPDLGLMGTIELTRVALDNVALCEALDNP